MKKHIVRVTLCALLICLLTAGSALADVSAHTRIYDGTRALLNNIDLAISALDGTNVWTDDIFSFNDLVGERTTEAGYQKAVNGRGVDVVGGGVSQVASTLYLALKQRGEVDYLDKQVYGGNFIGAYTTGSNAIVTDYKNGIDFSFLNEGSEMTISLWRIDSTVYCEIADGSGWDDDDGGWDDDWGDDDYIFPASDYKKLTRSQILGIPKSQWGYARNEIYARHGYEFHKAKYADYFESKNWYEPGGFRSKDLNATEWYNMDLIKQMERDSGSSSDGGTSGTSSRYIFPNSDWKKLTRAQVLDIPESQWGYARNEIYARHGYEFNTSKYRKYFAKKSWYEPGGFDKTDLSEVEWYNMDLIKQLEDEYGVS
ncbi:MAG: YARHG domain-containing protein [Clostridia bacterium]